MNVEGWKIKKLIEVYGKNNDIEEKSYLPVFCEKNKLNYIQWSAYTRGAQTVGIKIIYLLIDIFPDLNLNWLLKEDPIMFNSQNNLYVVNEPATEYVKTPKKVSNEDIMKKLEELEIEMKKLSSANG